MKFNFDMFSFVLGMIYTLILNLSVEPIKRRWRKQCNYDCDYCKVFDCPKHRCDYLKEKHNGTHN